jgi:hypothetical protein
VQSETTYGGEDCLTDLNKPFPNPKQSSESPAENGKVGNKDSLVYSNSTKE